MTSKQTLGMAVALGLAAALLAPATLAQQPASAAIAVAQQNAGRYERISVHGTSLEGNLEGDSADRQVSVYLPPGYDQSPRKRYPVLYLLHGYTDSDSRWFGLDGKHFVHVPTAIDKAWAAGAAHMIIVMPNAYTRYQGSMYSNSVTTGDWEAFVARDLVAYVDAHYRTLARRDSRGLAGHSMGGYGTVRIGMKYPQVFSSLYAMSPCCMGASLAPNAEMAAQAAAISSDADFAKAGFGLKAMLASAAAWSPNPAKPPRYFDLPVVDGKPQPEVIAAWAANAPLSMVHQYIPALRSFKAIAFDAGDKDVGIAATVRSLDQTLTGYGLKHDWAIYDGDHVSAIEQRLQTQVMPFFTRHLQAR